MVEMPTMQLQAVRAAAVREQTETPARLAHQAKAMLVVLDKTQPQQVEAVEAVLMPQAQQQLAQMVQTAARGLQTVLVALALLTAAAVVAVKVMEFQQHRVELAAQAAVEMAQALQRREA